MVLESSSDATTKRPRLPAGDEHNQNDAVPVAAHDHLSALPEALQLHILSFLPLKSAILTSSLCSSWRHLWEGRWQDDGNRSSLHHHLLPYSPSLKKLLDSLELRQSQGQGRLDRYSLVVATPAMSARRFNRYLAASAGCGVEDLHVELQSPPSPATLRFPFLPSHASRSVASRYPASTPGPHGRAPLSRPSSSIPSTTPAPVQPPLSNSYKLKHKDG